MARPKKVTEQPERNPEPITGDVEMVNEPPVVKVEEAPVKPLFEADHSETYRNLLLERPGVPVITNIQEAVSFMETYQKWNRKVQQVFK